ncbi:MAG: hypothetical protein H0T43_01230 [Solirubrobacterales bacterium]|nr:hypothetical protein [Solirubrobacterales bacterium]
MPERPPPPSQDITTSTLVAAVVLTAIIATGMSIFFVAALFERGPEGPRGPAGTAAPPAPAAETREAQLDAQSIADAIEKDPGPVTQALGDGDSDDGDGSGAAPEDEDLATRVDELESEVSAAKDDLTELCDELRSSDALLDAALPC